MGKNLVSCFLRHSVHVVVSNELKRFLLAKFMTNYTRETRHLFSRNSLHIATIEVSYLFCLTCAACIARDRCVNTYLLACVVDLLAAYYERAAV